MLGTIGFVMYDSTWEMGESHDDTFAGCATMCANEGIMYNANEEKGEMHPYSQDRGSC